MLHAECHKLPADSLPDRQQRFGLDELLKQTFKDVDVGLVEPVLRQDREMKANRSRFRMSAWAAHQRQTAKTAPRLSMSEQPRPCNAGALCHVESFGTSEPLACIRVLADRRPPRPVCDVPTNRLAQSGFEALNRRPTQLSLKLAGIDRIPQVVAGAICDESNQGSTPHPISEQLVYDVANFAHKL